MRIVQNQQLGGHVYSRVYSSVCVAVQHIAEIIQAQAASSIQIGLFSSYDFFFKILSLWEIEPRGGEFPQWACMGRNRDQTVRCNARKGLITIVCTFGAWRDLQRLPKVVLLQPF